MSDFFAEALQIAHRLEQVEPDKQKRIQAIMEEYWRANPRKLSEFDIAMAKATPNIGPYDWKEVTGDGPLPFRIRDAGIEITTSRVYTRTITFYGALE